MELNIKEKKENKAMTRQEIKFEVSYLEAPPKRMQVRDELAKQLKAKPETVIVQRIRNVFGMRKSAGSANIYSDFKNVLKFELKYKLKRMGILDKEGKLVTEKKKEEISAEEKPADAAASKPVAETKKEGEI